MASFALLNKPKPSVTSARAAKARASPRRKKRGGLDEGSSFIGATPVARPEPQLAQVVQPKVTAESAGGVPEGEADRVTEHIVSGARTEL